MLYRPTTTGATAPASALSGRNIAHAHRSVPELAFVGAGFHLNRIAITDPTVKQSAALVGVSVPYVHAAINIIDDLNVCEAVLCGTLNILDAAKRSHRESLVDHIKRSTPAELAAAAKEAGVDLIWDSMMLPNL